MIKIAIQDSGVPSSYTSALVDACISLGIDYECFGLVSYSDGGHKFTGNIFDDTQSLIIPFGSVKLVKLGIQEKLPRNWKFFYDLDGFDLLYQMGIETSSKDILAKYLLNANSTFSIFPNCANTRFDVDKFVKPVNDLKLFNGQILPKNKSLLELLTEQETKQSVYNNSQFILYADLLPVVKEWRCFVINGEVVGTSLYAEHGITKKEFEFPSIRDIHYIEALATMFEPAGKNNPYVVDICRLTDEEERSFDQFKIVEYNCFHSSGLYGINVEYMLRKLVDYFKVI